MPFPLTGRRFDYQATHYANSSGRSFGGDCTPLFGGDAAAQLPVAAGRQYTLSNSAWKLFIPSTYQQRPGDVADLLVHFHGDPQTVWNNALYANLNSIVLTVNYSGLSSAYSGPFSNSALFGSILNEALAKVRSQRDFSSTLAWDQLGVSSFSAGYGAVREILKSATYRTDIDALLAADSLYASTAGDGTPLDSQMVNYKTFASLRRPAARLFSSAIHRCRPIPMKVRWKLAMNCCSIWGCRRQRSTRVD